MEKKILFVADQPFEINFCTEVAKLLNKEFSCGLAIVDLFTFNYGPDVIEQARPFFQEGVFDLETQYRSWQVPRRKISVQHWQASQFQIKEFAASLVGQRDIETIRKTDVYSNNFEFSDWHKNFPEEIVDIAHADYLLWAQNVITSVKPSLICSISNTLLPGSLIYEISLINKIPHVVFSHSRIGSRWVAREDFAFGMSLQLNKKMADSRLSKVGKPHLDELRILFNTPERRIYSYTTSDASTYLKALFASSLITNFIRLLHILARWIYPALRSILTGPTKRKFRTRYFDQSFFRIQMFELKRRIRPIFAKKLFQHEISNVDRYFYWPLHYRPEGVVMVQGKGLDEIELINFVSELLPEGTKLYVKENPLMLGNRKLRIYRTLGEIKGVTLIAPTVSSLELIKGSIATICLTGTALLESQILEKPSWAIGSPEFLSVLNGSGFDDLPNFLMQASKGEVGLDLEILEKYIGWIFENSDPNDNLLWASFGIEDLRHDIRRVSELVKLRLLK